MEWRSFIIEALNAGKPTVIGNECGALIITTILLCFQQKQQKNENNTISIYQENACNHQSQRSFVEVDIERVKRNYAPNSNHVNTFSLTITKCKSHFCVWYATYSPNNWELRTNVENVGKSNYILCIVYRHTLTHVHLFRHLKMNKFPFFLLGSG